LPTAAVKPTRVATDCLDGDTKFARLMKTWRFHICTGITVNRQEYCDDVYLANKTLELVYENAPEWTILKWKNAPPLGDFGASILAPSAPTPTILTNRTLVTCRFSIYVEVSGSCNVGTLTELWLSDRLMTMMMMMMTVMVMLYRWHRDSDGSADVHADVQVHADIWGACTQYETLWETVGPTSPINYRQFETRAWTSYQVSHHIQVSELPVWRHSNISGFYSISILFQLTCISLADHQRPTTNYNSCCWCPGI